MQKKDHKQIMQDFRVRQTRQLFAMAITLLSLLFFVLLYKRPDLFGEISRDTIFAGQVVFIAAFIGFSAVNWRCPACNKYLGADINRRICRKCRTRLR
jgi:heme A synthase